MRGRGRIYQRKERWWIAYYVRGKEYRESAGSTKAEATRYLKKRLGEIHGGSFVGPKEERITINELLDNLILHLKTKGAKSVASFISHIKPVRETFGLDRVIDITPPRIEKFISRMKKEGFASATINRRVGAFKQSFNLARKQNLINQVPYFSRPP